MRQPTAANTRGDGWASPRAATARAALASRRRHAAEATGIRWTPPSTLERCVALALLVVAVPLLAAMFLFVLVVDGRPVLYSGLRLGLRKRPFVLYKVRTLRRDAPQHTTRRLLDARDGLEIRGGRLLRDTRLDELPQLWNIVRGEMRFVGPRPEREEVYRVHCASIPGYTKRFAVRPGMLGPSQLFTPHATPKRIRAWLDNEWSGRAHSVRELACLTGYTVLVAGRKCLTRALEAAWRDVVQGWLLRRYYDTRRLRRVKPPGAVASFATCAVTPSMADAVVLDANEEALLIASPMFVEVGTSMQLRVATEIAGGTSGPRIRHANCTGVVRRAGRRAGRYLLVVDYRPASARSLYVLQQYFLRNALACPRAPAAPGRRLATNAALRCGPLQARPLPLSERVFIPGPVVLPSRTRAGALGSVAETRR